VRLNRDQRLAASGLEPSVPVVCSTEAVLDFEHCSFPENTFFNVACWFGLIEYRMR